MSIKPEKFTISLYRWRDVVEYLENKHDRDLRDFAGRFARRPDGGAFNATAPFQDFWRFVLTSNDNQVSNRGSRIHVPEPRPDDASPSQLEPWQQQIIGWIWEDFPDADGQFWVEW